MKSIDYTKINEFQKEKRNEDNNIDNQNMEKNEDNENIDEYMNMNNNSNEKMNFDKNYKHEYKIKVLNTEEEIENERKKMEGYDFYVIDFSSLTKYTLRFEHYKSELYEDIKEKEPALFDGHYYRDTRSTIVHSIINKSIVKTLAPNSQDYNISYTFLDKNAYTELDEKVDIQSVIPFFILFFFVPCVCNLLVFLVIEKESRIKESLIIIGLKKSSFWVSWALVYSFIVIVSTVFVTVVMTICKMFINIHWSVLIVPMIIFGLSCCSISFILSTFIKKSKTANVVGVMLIMFFFAMFFLEMYVKKIPTLYTVCKFILSPISFLSLFNQLDVYDQQRIQINLFSLFRQPSLRISFLGLIFTFVCYIIIAIYLDNVLPQGNNFYRKWHFFVTDLFKRNKHKSFDSSHKNISNPYIQEDPNDKEKAVEIKNIGKTFKVKGERIEILKNIDFNAYYNEIFAILGHNGAGKTTLMSIMTGILSSTNGEVYYDSIPITGNETEVCKQFGYCPQFDTFNNDLTVGEHVKLFSGIKNINVDIDSILQDIDLLNKKNNFPKELSGGQRRKLCITLALLGSPKFVFLDEPTTGLDPYSRKNIWELLSRKKEGRVIFVTTHYMDEADLLADRKMIISNGNISCLGTSLFLKQQFNMNYSLDIHCKDTKDCSLLDKMIDQFCPGTSETKIISNTNMQIIDKDFNKKENENGDYLITYLLPMKYSKTFKDIFENINEMIKNNNNSIENFSLTAPTLEELFIKLENSDESNLKYIQATNTATINMISDNEQLVEKLDPVFRKTKINKSSSLRQIYSIVKLRLKIFIRNKTFAFLYTLLPVVLSILSIYIINLVLKQMNEPMKYQPFNISTSVYENEKWFKEANLTSPALDYINKFESANKLNLDTISYANDLSISSGKDTSKLNYAGGFYGYEGKEGLQFVIYSNITYNYVIPIGIDLLSNAILEQNNIKDRISVVYLPFDYYADEEYNENDKDKLFNIAPERLKRELESILIVGLSLCISLSISVFGPYTVKEREEGITHQLFLNGTKRINYWLGVLISDIICISVPIAIIILTGYLNDISLFHPKIIGFTIVMSIMWIVGCLLQQYVFSYFFKKYDRISTLFVIINPIISLAFGILIIVLSFSSYLVFDQDIDKIENDELRKEMKNAKIKLYIIYIVLLILVPGFIILIYGKVSSFLINKVVDFSEEDINTFLLSDEFKSIYSNTKISNEQKSKLIKKAFFDPRMPSIKDIFNCRDKFIILVIMAILIIVIYCTALFLIEKLKQKRLRKNKEYTPEEKSKNDEMIKNGPVDVRNEYKRVGHSLNDDNSNIVLKVFQLNKDFFMKAKDIKKRRKEEIKRLNEVNGITKNKKEKKKDKKKNKKDESAFEKMDNRMVYDEKKKKYINRIVDNVTFGVNMSECLGLLGPNGAGKTTSISMITGLLSHTHGIVKYGQKDLNETDMADLSLGYCSQHNSLWKLLTVQETVEFYLSICGYPSKDIPHYTKALLEACGIDMHKHKKVSEISGGTKRKLSLIVAICSSPSYLILDEPSAGMDPFTRRYMWKLISELKKARETATILTTHSTEEAEALCDRIAILIKGRLVCVDTPRSIKMNHSNTYTLEVFTSNPEEFEENFVKKQNLFGLESSEDYEVESSMSYQKYSVKMKTDNIAKVFAIMENAQNQNIVSQYNFGQYSLEQVFINFVNNSE